MLQHEDQPTNQLFSCSTTINDLTRGKHRNHFAPLLISPCAYTEVNTITRMLQHNHLISQRKSKLSTNWWGCCVSLMVVSHSLRPQQAFVLRIMEGLLAWWLLRTCESDIKEPWERWVSLYQSGLDWKVFSAPESITPRPVQSVMHQCCQITRQSSNYTSTASSVRTDKWNPHAGVPVLLFFVNWHCFNHSSSSGKDEHMNHTGVNNSWQKITSSCYIKVVSKTQKRTIGSGQTCIYGGKISSFQWNSILVPLMWTLTHKFASQHC